MRVHLQKVELISTSLGEREKMALILREQLTRAVPDLKPLTAMYCGDETGTGLICQDLAPHRH